MNLYFDSSAFAKRYLTEKGSEDVFRWTTDAVMCATSLITRAEIVSAIIRASRMGYIEIQVAERMVSDFRNDWVFLSRLPITEDLVARADRLACEFGLRGYDAVHLAAVLTWQENLNFPVTLATYDKELADAARQSGLAVLPE
jgi:predicted nucleic acid-binding protein